ncbi:MAG: dTDP-4-dehydrorhamnose 3,5-epimerase [Flavobacteriales bacterium]|nr:MAG: dTDP-4-dehydrorhamnose 3,5-epimerase [Flavobacteriales bacterium]
MQISELLPNLLLIKPTIFEDHRGHFFENFREDVLSQFGVKDAFIQDNQSLSHRGILRGLHFQSNPYAQGKLVRVITGAVLDVALDIRRDSLTYGQFVAIELSAANKLMLFIPPGFAHGFATLQNDTIFTYKCSQYYHPLSEGGVLWNSPSLAIPWQLENPILSDKDSQLPDFSDFVSPFN